jgi:DNA invertase Pin-like site-specific DNA recombinase
MASIGYARTSTVDQEAGLEAQIRDLRAARCEERNIYSERVSSIGVRPELELVLDRILREGDTLIVTRIDRLARSIADLVVIIQRVRARRAQLHILELGSTDPSSPLGELMVSMLGIIAQFERHIMLQRQREGIAKAKAEGKYKGRKPTVRAQAAEIRRLSVEGLTNAEIARRLGVHRSNVGRVLGAFTEKLVSP